MYIVLAAMDAELVDVLDHMSGREERSLGVLKVWHGVLAGRRVVAAKCGVGKVLAAMTTQLLVDRYRPQALIFTGLAGSLVPEIHIGDTIVARDCVQHDLDVRGLGFTRGTIPWTDYRFIQCDPALLGLAQTYQPDWGSLHVGRICTGDQFVGPWNRGNMAYLVDELKGHAVEMEGAAVGMVAKLHGVPFLLVRTISDSADDAASVRFEEFLPQASRNSLKALTHILSGLPA